MRSHIGADERVSNSESHISASDVCDNKDADIKDSEGSVSVGFISAASDRPVEGNQNSRDLDSVISLLVQASVLKESSSVLAPINEVDLGVLVSVHILG